MRFPEHEKLERIDTRRSQAIGEFLDTSGYVLAEYADDVSDELVPVYKRTEQILAGYFGVDLARLEQEKRQMLDLMRGTDSGDVS